MGKLIMISVIVATFALPMRHINAPSAGEAIRKITIEFCWFNLAYVLALAYLAPRF